MSLPISRRAYADRHGPTTAYGFRLHIPAGTAVRFEPGERKRVRLVALAGERIMYGGNGLIDGQLDEVAVREASLVKTEAASYSKK